MIHRNQQTSFRTTEFSLSGGFLHSLLKPKYLNINVGDLFEFLVDTLWHTVGALNNAVDFNLVNVFSPFTNFSHGYLPPPPKAAWPTGKALVFTFAVRNRRSYVDAFSPNTVRRHSNAVTHFGEGFNNRDFISISINMEQGKDWGCSTSKSNELQYVYNLIGAMTKSFVRRQNAYLTADEEYDDVHSFLKLTDMHSRFYRMPMKQMFLQVPYHLWVFNYHVWEYAPNVLSQRLITPTVALYYFMYLNDAIPKSARVVRDVTMLRLGLDPLNVTKVLDDGIAGHLASSIIQLVQQLRTTDVQLTDKELLAPAVLDAFFKNGSTQLSTRPEYMGDIMESFRDLLKTLKNHNDVGMILLPAKDVARRLLIQDTNWRNTAITALSN